jgi:hypothetical protein
VLDPFMQRTDSLRVAGYAATGLASFIAESTKSRILDEEDIQDETSGLNMSTLGLRSRTDLDDCASPTITEEQRLEKLRQGCPDCYDKNCEQGATDREILSVDRKPVHINHRALLSLSKIVRGAAHRAHTHMPYVNWSFMG